MRRTTLVLAAMVALVAFPALAQQFDNYHYNASMNCSDCHSMHASAHNNVLGGAGAAIATPATTVDAGAPPLKPWSDGTARMHLLKSDTLCESCHDGTAFAPDVVGTNSNGYIRSAGGTVVAGETAGGHEIGNTVVAPGLNAATNGGWHPAGTALECVSCHSPHGTTYFRNLGPYGLRNALGYGNTQFYPTVTKSTTWSALTDVNINIDGTVARVWGTDPLATYYARGVVSYTRNAAGILNPLDSITASNRMDHFCGVCHGNFHGGSDADLTVGAGAASGAFIRHPTSTVLVATTALAAASARETAFNNLKVYQAAGTADELTDSPGCLTCHKAHGNGNPFGLIYPSGLAADTTEEGDGTTFKSLCKTCHPMGGAHPF